MNLIVHIPDDLADDSTQPQPTLDLTDASLIAAMQASPYRDMDIEPSRERSLGLSPAAPINPQNSTPDNYQNDSHDRTKHGRSPHHR